MTLNGKGRPPAPPSYESLGVRSRLAAPAGRAGGAALRADLNPAEPCSLHSCAGCPGRRSSTDGACRRGSGSHRAEGLLLNPKAMSNPHLDYARS
jgi:hypothetical protein